MKGAFLALAASALLGSAAAGSLHNRRHAHQAFHLRRNTPAPVDSATCSCTTYVTTFYGEASLMQGTELAQMTQSPQETQSAQETQSEQETTTSTAIVQPTTTVQSTQYTTITVVPTASSSAVQSAAPVASSSSVESSSAPAAPASSVESSSAPAASSVESSSAPAAPASSVESSSAPAAPASSVESSSAPAAPASSVKSSSASVAPVSSAESSSAPAAPVAPTAFVTVCPTPGTYTIPATTMTLTSETTVAAPAMATLSSSSESQTYGGVTTVVETSTTIVCPYATVSPTGSTFTSVIMTTTYVCPSSGTYVIAPTTTSVSESTVMVYPTPASYSAGTYTQPETTITITRTSDVFVCPYTSSAATTTQAPSTSSAPAAAVPVSSAAPSSSAAASSSAPAAAVSVYPAASSSASPSSSAPVAAVSVYHAASSSAASSSAAPVAPASQSSSQSSSVAVSSSSAVPTTSAPASPIGGGNQWCITYSPYTSSGQCKDSTAVLADIAIISSKGFSSVRIYSTDCNGLKNVGAAAQQHNLKLVLGVYISKTGISAAQAQVTEIVNWASGNWAAVEMIVIGNEAVFNHYASMSELASFISSAKSTFQSAGFTGHVTTTEPMNIIQEEGSILCAIVDVLSANIHPFFNPETTASEAGQFVANQLKDLEKVCPGLSTYNLETGWPHSGNANGAAVPGSSQQEEAIKSIQESAGGKSVFFSFIDDMWKEPGALGVEQSWGCSQLFGN